MDSGKPFVSLASLPLPTSSRLLRSACCPDKDLVVTVCSQNGKDRITLWKMQGSKKWEVEVHSGLPRNESVVDLAWSPDGQAIVLVHHPPRITVHSIQDGHEERSLPFAHALADSARLTGVWWFKDEKEAEHDSIPDIFKRGPNISGSAHSILKMLPLLDPVSDSTRALTASQLFSFQETPSTSKRADLPEAIETWPTLPPNLMAASIQPLDTPGEQDGNEHDDPEALDSPRVNSILVVSDDTGHIHCFLDGSYPLGAVLVAANSTTSSLRKSAQSPILLPHQHSLPGETTLLPTLVELPLLDTKIPRDMARISTTTRELVWYVMRVMDEMHAAWFGSGTQLGAREPGIRWLKALDDLQVQTGASVQGSTTSLLDLTLLLLAGKSSETISDFIGSGEQMSERGLQKWESTVVETLTKLRDFSGLRIAPACQRIHLLLEETLGWSQLPRMYAACELNKEEIANAMNMAGRAIFSATWLSTAARRQLSRFKEFMKWLRFEIGNANPVADQQSANQPRHDVLEVNEYIMSGLVKSEIDAWFTEGVPVFSPQEIGVPQDKQNLSATIERARAALKDPSQTTWAHQVEYRSVSHLDKNLHALIRDLASQCQGIFLRAASATARAAATRAPRSPRSARPQSDDPSVHVSYTILERNVEHNQDPALPTQYLAAHDPSAGDDADLCVLRLVHDPIDPGSQVAVGVALLQCGLDEGGSKVSCTVLDFDFFDDDSLIVAFRANDATGSTTIAVVGYSDLQYQESQPIGPVTELSREELILQALQQQKAGQIVTALMPIKRSHVLAGCSNGEVSLALNGRAGRRVACVLDRKEAVLKVLDIEGDADDESWEEGGETESA